MQNWEWGREEMWVPNSRRNDETFIKRDSLWIEAAVHSSIEQRKHNFTAVKYEVLVSFCVCVCVCAYLHPRRGNSIPHRKRAAGEWKWVGDRARTYLFGFAQRARWNFEWKPERVYAAAVSISFIFSAPLLTGAQPEWFSWKEKEGSKMWISLFMQC